MTAFLSCPAESPRWFDNLREGLLVTKSPLAGCQTAPQGMWRPRVAQDGEWTFLKSAFVVPERF